MSWPELQTPLSVGKVKRGPAVTVVCAVEPSISTRYSRVGAAIRVLEVSLDLSELNALDNEILAMHPKILEVSLTSPQVDDSDLFRRVFFVLLFRLLHGAVETANPIQG